CHGCACIYRTVSLIALMSCFFFQAEDGIRDFHVTGVQTCALPISVATLLLALPSFEVLVQVFQALRERLALEAFEFFTDIALARSEERRVGKEWRSRWSR